MLDQTTIHHLGVYDLFEIFNFLPMQELLKISELSHDFKNIVDQPSFWRTQYRACGLPEPEEDVSRTHFVHDYQVKANQLHRELEFLSQHKAALLDHFSQSVNFNKIVRSLNFILSKKDDFRNYKVHLGDLDKVIDIFNQMLAKEQAPLDGWRHVRFNFLTRNIEQQLSTILERNPQDALQVNRITSIDLRYCMMTSLPQSLKGFAYVESLNLYDTYLRQLPEFLSGYNHLRQLCISGGKFSEIPEVLLHCRALRSLCLPDNQLEVLPQRSRALRNLEVLFLHDNKLVDLPDSFNLNKLTQITLNGNQLNAEACAQAQLMWPKLINPNILFQTQKSVSNSEAHTEVTEDHTEIAASSPGMAPLLHQFNQMNLSQDRQDEALALGLERGPRL